MNGKKVKLDYRLEQNDLIEHKTIRIEPPCLDIMPKIIFEN